MARNMVAAGVLCTFFAGVSTPAFAQGASYSDQDWNATFIDNCGLPAPSSVTPITVEGDQKLQVTLAPGDKGKCSSDNRTRHRAPFWERAELAQEGRMALGGQYRISAELRFVQGFSGEREAFMQIHGYAQGCKKAYPPLMLKFDQGTLKVETLRGVSLISSGRHRNVLKQQISVRDLYGRPLALALDFDTRKHPGRLSVSLNGARVVSDVKVDFAPCAEPHVKIGVYRPGGKGSGISQVVFDDLKVERVE